MRSYIDQGGWYKEKSKYFFKISEKLSLVMNYSYPSIASDVSESMDVFKSPHCHLSKSFIEKCMIINMEDMSSNDIATIFNFFVTQVLI